MIKTARCHRQDSADDGMVMWIRDVGGHMEDLCLHAERRRNEVATLIPRG